MVVVTAVLLAAALLKAIAVGNAVRWLHARGPVFRAALAERRPTTIVEQTRLYDEVGAAFFPFGLKDYRLRRLLGGARGARRVAVWPARVLSVLLFRVAVLVPVSSGYLVLLASVDVPPLHGGANDVLALVLACVLLAITIGLAIEAVYAYAVLGSYGIGFHELRPERRGPERALVREFQVFAGTLMVAYAAGIGATYLVAVRFGGYRRIPVRSGPGAIVEQVIDSAYYALLAFSGAGDPEPLGPAGKVVTGAIAVQGMALLLLVLASMLAIADRGGADRAVGTRPEPVAPAPVVPPNPPADPPAGRPGLVGLVVGAALGAALAVALRARHRRRVNRNVT
jgi:hypothetical protein